MIIIDNKCINNWNKFYHNLISYLISFIYILTCIAYKKGILMLYKLIKKCKSRFQVHNIYIYQA